MFLLTYMLYNYILCMNNVGLTPAEIRQLKTDDVDTPISKSDFEQALNRVAPSVGQADLQKYQDWMNEFGST